MRRAGLTSLCRSFAATSISRQHRPAPTRGLSLSSPSSRNPTLRPHSSSLHRQLPRRFCAQAGEDDEGDKDDNAEGEVGEEGEGDEDVELAAESIEELEPERGFFDRLDPKGEMNKEQRRALLIERFSQPWLNQRHEKLLLSLRKEIDIYLDKELTEYELAHGIVNEDLYKRPDEMEYAKFEDGGVHNDMYESALLRDYCPLEDDRDPVVNFDLSSLNVDTEYARSSRASAGMDWLKESMHLWDGIESDIFEANRNPSHAAFGEYLEDEFPPEQHAELREMKRAYIDGRMPLKVWDMISEADQVRLEDEERKAAEFAAIATQGRQRDDDEEEEPYEEEEEDENGDDYWDDVDDDELEEVPVELNLATPADYGYLPDDPQGIRYRSREAFEKDVRLVEQLLTVHDADDVEAARNMPEFGFQHPIDHALYNEVENSLRMHDAHTQYKTAHLQGELFVQHDDEPDTHFITPPQVLDDPRYKRPVQQRMQERRDKDVARALAIAAREGRTSKEELFDIIVGSLGVKLARTFVDEATALLENTERRAKAAEAQRVRLALPTGEDEQHDGKFAAADATFDELDEQDTADSMPRERFSVPSYEEASRMGGMTVASLLNEPIDVQERLMGIDPKAYGLENFAGPDDEIRKMPISKATIELAGGESDAEPLVLNSFLDAMNNAGEQNQKYGKTFTHWMPEHAWSSADGPSSAAERATGAESVQLLKWLDHKFTKPTRKADIGVGMHPDDDPQALAISTKLGTNTAFPTYIGDEDEQSLMPIHGDLSMSKATREAIIQLNNEDPEVYTPYNLALKFGISKGRADAIIAMRKIVPEGGLTEVDNEREYVWDLFKGGYRVGNEQVYPPDDHFSRIAAKVRYTMIHDDGTDRHDPKNRKFSDAFKERLAAGIKPQTGASAASTYHINPELTAQEGQVRRAHFRFVDKDAARVKREKNRNHRIQVRGNDGKLRDATAEESTGTLRRVAPRRKGPQCFYA